MALKVKKAQDEGRVAEARALECEALHKAVAERARESDALCKALAEKLQRAEEGAAGASGAVVQVAVSTQTAMEEEVVPVQVAVSTQTAVVEEVKEPEADPQEAVQGSDQLLFGTIRHDAIWLGNFP